MNILVGIDQEGRYRSSLRLLNRLSFRRPVAELLHVVEPDIAGIANSVSPATAGTFYMDDRWNEDSSNLLNEAQDEACGSGLDAKQLRLIGKPAATLMERASEIHADLIAIGSTHKSAYGALVLGSVGRKLTIAARPSLLIAKKDPPAEGPLTAVFATDCSDYADTCLRMLARMEPCGIGRLILVNAIDEGESADTRANAESKIAKLVDHLIEAGIGAEGQVVTGSPAEVIEAEMLSTKADLLVMAAQGHGFLDRLLIGSLSLQEAVATPHSLLLLRLP